MPTKIFQRYAKYLGEHFGTTIPGIFTDETEPPAWSPHIEDALSEQVSFERDLPALYHSDHPRSEVVRLAVRECALRLFQERWEAPIAGWCRRANLIWGAEKPTWRPSQFGAIAQPSTDAGHRRAGAPPEPLTAELRANHRAAMAAAEHQENTEVRCENFHSLGWGATLQDQKWATDWLAAQGVNRFTPHAFYASSAGLQKHDAAPSFFEENPYWPHFKLLADYTARLSLALSKGREKARIAVLHPTRALWNNSSPSSSARQEYEALLNTLLQQHFIFHIVGAKSILEVQARDGGLEIGLARYETLLVPSGAEDDQEVLGAIEKARFAGLGVLGEGWLEALRERRDLSVRGPDGREIETVWAAWREARDQEILFLANTSGEALRASVQVRSKTRSWEEWSLESGQARPFRVQESGVDGTSTCSVELAAFGSILLIGRGETAAVQAEAGALAAARKARIARLPLGGEWKVELDRPNALRLNRWRAASLEGDWQGEVDDSAWAEVEALPLRYRDTVRGGWQQPVKRRQGVPVWYRRHIECDAVPSDTAREWSHPMALDAVGQRAERAARVVRARRGQRKRQGSGSCWSLAEARRERARAQGRGRARDGRPAHSAASHRKLRAARASRGGAASERTVQRSGGCGMPTLLGRSDLFQAHRREGLGRHRCAGTATGLRAHRAGVAR